MKNVIPVLAAALIATTGASSAAQAALVDFGVAALGGTITFGGGSTLDNSSSLDLDGAILVVSSLGAGDESGLTVFPGGVNNTVVLTHPIDYGTGSGVVNTPIDVVKTWTGIVGGHTDSFTETLTKVTDIDRATMNAITVTLSGTLSDTLGLFVDTPANLILGANQVEGGGSAISASMTNTAASSIPEPSTWVMMALGFVALGYAAVRRSSKDRSVLAV
jgi:PEP-CTERM motif-containing protein